MTIVSVIFFCQQYTTHSCLITPSEEEDTTFKDRTDTAVMGGIIFSDFCVKE